MTPPLFGIISILRDMNIKHYLAKRFRDQIKTANAELLNELRFAFKNYIGWTGKSEYLSDRAINSREPGVSSRRLCDEEVVVSLTSYGKRIYEAYLAIESIMQGTVKPNRIVLWLPDGLKDVPLPQTLRNQQQRGLQIEYCRDIGPYTKLIYALKAFPEACIITIDDDAVYFPDLVENLVNTHVRNPDCVCASRIHTMQFEGGKLKGYMDWNRCSAYDTPDIRHFATGVSGVLYTPHAFPDEVFNEEVFLKLCGKADDVWFNAMLILNNMRIVKSFTHSPEGYDNYRNPDPLEVGLCGENVDSPQCMNNVYLDAVWKKYDLYRFFEN